MPGSPRLPPAVTFQPHELVVTLLPQLQLPAVLAQQLLVVAVGLLDGLADLAGPHSAVGGWLHRPDLPRGLRPPPTQGGGRGMGCPTSTPSNSPRGEVRLPGPLDRGIHQASKTSLKDR